MKLIDKALLKRFSEPGPCQHCGKRCPQGRDPAHIFSRGAGRVDIAENLVSLCRECHTRSHGSGKPSRAELLEIAARREKTTPEEIEARVMEIRRDNSVKVLRVSDD